MCKIDSSLEIKFHSRHLSFPLVIAAGCTQSFLWGNEHCRRSRSVHSRFSLLLLLSLVLCFSTGPLWATFLSEAYLLWHGLIHRSQSFQESTCSTTEHLLVLWPHYSLCSSFCLSITLFSPCSLPLSIFCLKHLFTRYHQLGWWVHLWVPCKDSWKQVCPA